ncbi:hypothetical protein BpHYR1_035395 [Brachionus plicatilis]|uniref:Uncharacterized protein n=1 Tax=Brachionus plicatilis TaxID=10195 RepID=A0A3M7Q0F1_BRAPC|nr:hypothetical protein BpHYR1_035395 [Brachionus plicatilis]
MQTVLFRGVRTRSSILSLKVGSNTCWVRKSRLDGRPLFLQTPPEWYQFMSGKLKFPATNKL